jgi:hypothetical protein
MNSMVQISLVSKFFERILLLNKYLFIKIELKAKKLKSELLTAL